MPIPQHCLLEPLTVDPDSSARAAARTMGEEHVGSLVVVDAERHPVGVVTDRDLALYVLSNRADAAHVTVRECMSAPAVTLAASATLEEASSTMRRHALRRLPIVGEDGALLGIVTADDLVTLLAEELGQLAKAIRRGYRNEVQASDSTSIFGKE